MKRLPLTIVLAAVLGAPTLTHAHSDPTVLRYVANDGRDVGNCAQAAQPCRTLAYALKQSGEGDEVRVAAGQYRVSSLERLRILSGVVHVQGGYQRADGFAASDVMKHPSFISGLADDEENTFAAHGFRAMVDAKGVTIADNADDQTLKLFKQTNAAIEGPASCVGGKAGAYSCQNVDLLSHIPLNEFSIHAENANDIIGFADKNDNHEYALIGLNVGTAVIDVTDAAHPREVGLITGVNNLWRDISVYQYYDSVAARWKSYAYVTSEGVQGLQIIDMTGLPSKVTDGGTINTYFKTAHTLYINTDYAYGTPVEGVTPHLFIAGAGSGMGKVYGGSMQILDLVDPLHPKQVFAQTSADRSDYMHDSTGMVISDERAAQCVSGHNPCEVLFDFNEGSLDIWDVTDKKNPTRLSRTPYAQNGYSHSGWYSNDKRYLILDDELDEVDFHINTLLRTFDLSDLRAPHVVANYYGPTHAIDHNSYVRGNFMYTSHYRRGLVVSDVTDPTRIAEKGYFDTSVAFADDAAEFNGAWGTWPFLPSGNVLISDIEGGLFVLKHRADGTDTGGGTTPPAHNNDGGGGGSLPLAGLLVVGLALVFRLRRL